MTEEASEQSKPKYAAGDEVAIVGGKKNVGVRGVVFWTGENKYGPGFRYGVRDDDGEAYWVDEEKLGSPETAPPPPDKEPYVGKPELAKGTRVEITGGREGKGETGDVFWVGDSKFGKGKRYGVRGDDQETYWVDEKDLEVLREPSADEAAPAANRAAPTGAPPNDDAPLPDPDDFADFDDSYPEPPPEDIPF